MKRRTWLIGTGTVVGGALGVGVLGLVGRDAYFAHRAKEIAGPSLLAGWIATLEGEARSPRGVLLSATGALLLRLGEFSAGIG